MTKYERETQYNTVFKRPIIGRLCALALLLTLPISAPVVFTLTAITNGELEFIKELWELVKWNERENSND